MTDETQGTQPLPQPGSPFVQPGPSEPGSFQTPGAPAEAASNAGAVPAQNPEVIVGAAFAAGFGLAMILRRLTR